MSSLAMQKCQEQQDSMIHFTKDTSAINDKATISPNTNQPPKMRLPTTQTTKTKQTKQQPKTRQR
jgi:hypothetical protein